MTKELPRNPIERLPMIPIRDVVVFPHMMIPFVIGRPSSVRALDFALEGSKRIFLATQMDASVDEPKATDIYTIGTIATIVQSVKLSDGNIKVLVEGVRRGSAIRFSGDPGFFVADVELLEETSVASARTNLLVKRLQTAFEQFSKLSHHVNYDAILNAMKTLEPSKLADNICANLPVSIEEKQQLLEMADLAERIEKINEIIEVEIEKIKVDRNIQGRVKRQMERAQKEYYLNEKMKAIQKELGRKDEKSELDDLKRQVEAAKMPKDAHEKATKEIQRLEMMPPMSAESTVSRTYLDWLLAVPWNKKSKEIRDIVWSQKVLEEDHYGLDKIKDRILEFLAVRSLVKKPQGTILCFVGPPGVGKTSLGKSIARATGRKFVRLSLGGVRDEAEIRGHRRTYIGALPGQIIQYMKKAGTRNPVFMLDEVDKMSMDFRGDPSAALLEVLDPEQNHMFVDHYLDTEFDLSMVMFIATANVLHTIPRPLQDRMEVIQLSGYTENEKLEIAKRFLVPKQVETNGLKVEQIQFTDGALLEIIRRYTRESGVRNLEREIANICRKTAKRIVTAELEKSTITPEEVEKLLGRQKFRFQCMNDCNQVGLTTGLAWTEVGGEVLQTEATLMEGKGNLTLTGKLGEVMQESARAAMTFVRSRAADYGIGREFHRKMDLHIHIPEGAIPKDGPSAGITMATTIVSAMTKIPVRNDVAMTGEITLRGKVLPIGGVKEKLLAAHRAGIKHVILPKENEKDLQDIPSDILDVLNVNFVETMDEVLDIALESKPAPRQASPVSDIDGIRPNENVAH
ncbi:MAG TPA: endopeptidase La [Acidobacteriota bacterium]|nr:endopeptidase La [Acidobacteriota bacterium]